jgi:hypothetical protein
MSQINNSGYIINGRAVAVLPYGSRRTFFNREIQCKCGTIPEVGGIFWYRSKYGSVVVGTIKSIEPTSIVSTEGVSYPKNEIETKNRATIRDEKLENLGIK